MAKLLAACGLLVVLVLGVGCGGGSQSVAVSTTTTSTTPPADSRCLTAAKAWREQGSDDESEMVNQCRSLEEMELAIASAWSIPREDGLVRNASKLVSQACAMYIYEGPVCESLPN